MLLELSGCADMQTISRRTTLDNDTTAIHLDAQQRLVIAKGLQFCAEPSPDALAAYAASLGLGVSVPGQGAASVAAALQSSAGSIGLRTQSITLMRDVLYRMCEASVGGTLNSLEVSAFLRRSQDLTAVILAIEQLTGAIAANQIILNGSANAESSATLLSNQAAIEEATRRVKKKEEELAAAKKDYETRKTAREEADKKLTDKKTALTAAETAFNTKKKEFEKADEKYQALKKNDSAEKEKLTIEAREDRAKKESDKIEANTNLENAKQAVKDAESDLEKAVAALNTAEKDLKRAEDLKQDADDFLKAIRAAGEGAITEAKAQANGSGRFTHVNVAKTLDTKATEKVAEAVKGIVEMALKKSYIPEACLSYLAGTTESVNSRKGKRTDNSQNSDTEKNITNEKLEKICEAILTQSAANVFAEAVDPSVVKITYMRNRMGETVFKQKIEEFFKKEIIKIKDYDNFLTSTDYKDARKRFIEKYDN